MRFGKTLRESIYPPWKAAYIDYSKLKMLLRDDEGAGSDTEGGESGWTEDDENRFCDEIFNVQLEKVARFQEEQSNLLRERADASFEKLRELTPGEKGSVSAKSESDEGKDSKDKGKEKSEITVQRVREIEAELDSITNELRQLKRYSTINYTGFLKIVKKHDRKRGNHYRVRPMMQVSLARRPFNSEAGYSPLLAKLSLMYEAVHQYLNPDEAALPVDLETQPETKHNGERYLASKFWVHPDNLLEVKTMVLRHLPALVYSESSAKEADATVDPTLTSLYFDSGKFPLYKAKLDHTGEASSLRLRWYGQLATKPELYLDQKSVQKDGTSDERRITIKDKYVKPFLDGKYTMEKSIQKMERQGESAENINAFRTTAEAIQAFVTEKHLEPVMRANYVRTAFQKPADDRVRVSIDTSLAFIREDNFDRRHPCRDPAEWHRRDIDTGSVTYPFSELPPSDVSRFPYAILEIKVREDGTTRKRPAWVEDLMSSHLVHPVPHFSKFIHGTAVLFDDYVNQLPFWLSDLERDIRRDPQEAFAEEELRRAQRAADEQVVGSFLGTTGKQSSYKPAKSSPAAKSSSYLAGRMASEASVAQRVYGHSMGTAGENGGESSSANGLSSNGISGNRTNGSAYGAISSVLPSFSMTRYAKWRRAKETPELPEGVTEPTEWLKNSGPLRIEPKVWLANERTFLKWQHICVLLGSLSIALFTAAGSDNMVASTMGLVYILVAAFSGFWGWYMLHTRRDMIIARSGRDFDNMIGPIVVSVALMVALILNLVFAYRAAFERWADEGKAPAGNATLVQA
ncbi:vacuolar transporter chaperone 2 [Ophiostoma piceae UAMH 11346]|uniref:Vacuolar transporter chaperone 2 n=1 Tax=Ophiostoma piceae (strain UAMH 11346) TaxID=1262450 RepID=S3D603_OPHP1|nr:vacuolar transporter chaperone 2 [Ophiostoma piceae UAMH 11346]